MRRAAALALLLGAVLSQPGCAPKPAVPPTPPPPGSGSVGGSVESDLHEATAAFALKEFQHLVDVNPTAGSMRLKWTEKGKPSEGLFHYNRAAKSFTYQSPSGLGMTRVVTDAEMKKVADVVQGFQ